MFSEFYHLYCACFKDYPASEEVFCEQLQPENAVIISTQDGDRLIGYALLHESSIALLCVDPDYRNQGIGSKLLALSEEDFLRRGKDRILLGRGKHYLLQGVPINDCNAHEFFQRRGYSADWVSVNMELRTEGFDLSSLDLPPLPSDVSFRLADDADHDALIHDVKDANPNWVRIFETCDDPIILATQNGEIVGFEIVGPTAGRFGSPDETVGSLGCVGVVHSARNRGIGRQMVANGVDWLKSQGCDAIELRYVALVDWYERVGFRVHRRQWMGEKIITNTAT